MTLKLRATGLAAFWFLAYSTAALGTPGQDALREAARLYQGGQYFSAARQGFVANEAEPALEAESYSWITLGLTRAGLHQSAAYFFIKTLQSGNKLAIRRVLTVTEDLFVKVGSDLLKTYLIRHSSYEDYSPENRSAFLFALARAALLAGDAKKAAEYVGGISRKSVLWAYAMEVRGTANAILNRVPQAIEDFKACEKSASDWEDSREGQDLESRCIAGQARTLYQADRFDEAERTYDLISKSSIVWPDILFEQAWNAFAKKEYNRTLGKLVSYKSPALEFVYNSEVDVLSAQTYLMLCLYNDANLVINEFNSKYARTGDEIKKFVESNDRNLEAFFEAGKTGVKSSLYVQSGFYRQMNRFVRGPYFQRLVAAEEKIQSERYSIARFSQMAGIAPTQGFGGFLGQVLDWRKKSVRQLGGAFVRNSLIDYQKVIISDFEKMAFIKLEMLSKAKEKLIYKNVPKGTEDQDRTRGNVEPTRKDDQYYWSFNGEFWNDELGDYVFGLESACGT